MPLTQGEIHLEPILVKEVHKEYTQDLEMQGYKPYQLRYFYKLWVDLFPHVKIRQYKGVTGKCDCCSTLSYLR
jgi:hypothetical protein